VKENDHRAPDQSIVSQLSDSGKWLELAEEARFRASNIAKKLDVSSRQFRRVVRAIFGSAPEEVLTDGRLVLSKKVLQRRRRVKDAAVLLGYKQPSHFSRQFKARYGVSPKAFDGRGNYTIGVREQLIFPEIDFNKVDKLRGMNISIITTARNDEQARALLKGLGMPFRA